MFLIVFDQGASNTQANRLSLPGEATTFDVHHNIKLAVCRGGLKRSVNRLAAPFDREVLLGRTFSDYYRTIVGEQIHARNGGHATADCRRMNWARHGS